MTVTRQLKLARILLIVLLILATTSIGNHRVFVVRAQFLPNDNIKHWHIGSPSSSAHDESKQQSSSSKLLSPFVFQTDRPDHVIEGTSHAIGNTFKGVVGGAVGFFGLPIVGANYGGLKGFLIGSIVGTLTGISLPVVGLILGLSQMVRGLKCTPSAIQNSWNNRGKSCDTEYLLDVEVREVIDKMENLDHVEQRSDRRVSVKNTLYYELLGVTPDGTSSEIKRGFYKAAKASHPDKSNDADATEKFRQVHVAYQTLSDAKKRKRYDQYGPSMNERGEFLQDDHDNLSAAIDPLVFFAILFGSELVEPYIGELRIASEVDNVVQFVHVLQNGEQLSFDTAGYSFSWESSSTLQQKRQVDIAINLRQRISSYVTGAVTKNEFVYSCMEEAEAIAKSTFGAVFLKAIGASMMLEAEHFLGYHTAILGWAKGGISWLKKKAHTQRTDLNVYMTCFRAAKGCLDAVASSLSFVLEQMDMNEDDPFRSTDSEKFKWGGTSMPIDRNRKKGEPSKTKPRTPQLDKEKLEEELLHSLSTFLELAWAFNVRDVSETVKDSCHKIFADEGVEIDERLKRAEALRILGREFYRVGKASIGNELVPRSVMKDIQARAEVAFTTATLKAQGHDVPRKTEEEITRRQKEQAAEHEQEARMRAKVDATKLEGDPARKKAPVAS